MIAIKTMDDCLGSLTFRRIWAFKERHSKKRRKEPLAEVIIMVDHRDEQVKMVTIGSFVDGCVKSVGYGTVEADFGILAGSTLRNHTLASNHGNLVVDTINFS
ncbi:MAG: hypothetical protein ABFC94_04135 [Syntrophomonas sp.]